MTRAVAARADENGRKSLQFGFFGTPVAGLVPEAHQIEMSERR